MFLNASANLSRIRWFSHRALNARRKRGNAQPGITCSTIYRLLGPRDVLSDLPPPDAFSRNARRRRGDLNSMWCAKHGDSDCVSFAYLLTRPRVKNHIGCAGWTPFELQCSRKGERRIIFILRSSPRFEVPWQFLGR